jgi:4-hydroxybutyryl-CoA dehydratase / vinylacetyl-CoA-Delta-isomerase
MNVLMSGNDYRESLRRYRPKVYVSGHEVQSVADEPQLAPGVNALALTYDYALREELAPLMRADSGNRMLAVPRSSQDLLNKLEAVRLVCQQTGCAQRYLAGDAFAALRSATHRVDAELQTDYSDRLSAYLKQVWSDDLAIGIAMTDAKGDRTERPAAQANADAYLHIAGRRGDGIVLRGAKAIVTGAPYMHELLVMPCRNMTQIDADYAVCCAVPIDAPGLTLVARPAMCR